MSLCQVQNHENPVEPFNLASAATSNHSHIMAALNRITRDFDEERASRLAAEAVVLANSGQLEVGIRLVCHHFDPADFSY
jgi:hypothetical protein